MNTSENELLIFSEGLDQRGVLKPLPERNERPIMRSQYNEDHSEAVYELFVEIIGDSIMRKQTTCICKRRKLETKVTSH